MKKTNMPRLSILLLFSLFLNGFLPAQSPEPLAEWRLHPYYQLQGNATNYPGPRVDLPVSRYQQHQYQPEPLVVNGHFPTQRYVDFARAKAFPSGDLSVEMWLLYHVNQPVGSLISRRSKTDALPDWTLSTYGKEVEFSLRTESDSLCFLKTSMTRGYKNYWVQIVATIEQDITRIYINGELAAEKRIPNRAEAGKNTFLEAAAYMENEPYMELANMVKLIRVYDRALTADQIAERQEAEHRLIDRGVIYPDLFHFMAGPYLHLVTPKAVNLAWETDRPTRSARVRYGEQLPLDQTLELSGNTEEGIEAGQYIRTATLAGLKSGTPYFYELELVDADDDTIRSGILTFATAPDTTRHFSFAVIGDTEARPHVNFQVSKKIWQERPDFLLNLGDLTDGGKQARKFEWPVEYFTGMNALCSRIPVFPVPGNGEGDLYWYRQYHRLPGDESFYSFRYGNAEFFMLNSNEREEFTPGGRQYAWLEEQLKNSTADWKFVAHHHAPYSSDENDYGDSWEGKSDHGDLEVRKIVPLYEKYGVDVVFFGHLHTYQRTLPIYEGVVNKERGVTYIQGGGGGGNLEDFAPTRSWFSSKTYPGHHYFILNIEDDVLNLKMYDSDGVMKDFLTIDRN